MTAPPYVETDGGRAAAGFTGTTGDCATRAITLASGLPYRDVYDRINALAKRERTGTRKRTRSNARLGVHRVTMHWLLVDGLGALWTPTGTRCVYGYWTIPEIHPQER